MQKKKNPRGRSDIKKEERKRETHADRYDSFVYVLTDVRAVDIVNVRVCMYSRVLCLNATFSRLYE